MCYLNLLWKRNSPSKFRTASIVQDPNKNRSPKLHPIVYRSQWCSELCNHYVWGKDFNHVIWLFHESAKDNRFWNQELVALVPFFKCSAHTWEDLNTTWSLIDRWRWLHIHRVIKLSHKLYLWQHFFSAFATMFADYVKFIQRRILRVAQQHDFFPQTSYALGMRIAAPELLSSSESNRLLNSSIDELRILLRLREAKAITNKIEPDCNTCITPNTRPPSNQNGT